MFINIIYYITGFVFIRVFAYNDFNNDVTLMEMFEEGKNQYQLLQERGKLPQYGECWKSAVEQVHEGCRYLNEEIQSDLALRMTNCFLEMSGHETYNCDLDKKQNLRRICISSMSDRAFNVYTEFYTHAQNICWFLRGLIWQEKISERTHKVGEQLKTSLTQQDALLRQQEESLKMQQQLLNYGKDLETILQDIQNSSFQHLQLLNLLTSHLTGLQSWLIGEISWFDTLIFYLVMAIVIIFVTSTQRTSPSRLPLFVILSMNFLIERAICKNYSPEIDRSAETVHENLYTYIWYCRQFTICLSALAVSLQAYFYQDYLAYNNRLLLHIKTEIEKLKPATPSSRHSVEPEIMKPVATEYYKHNTLGETVKPVATEYYNTNTLAETVQPVVTEYYKNNSDTLSELSKRSVSTDSSFANSPAHYQYGFMHARASVSSQKDTVSSTSSVRRYNLRSNLSTPIHY